MLATIPIDLISIGDRLRGVDDEHLATLISSIQEVGLLNPITVHRRQVVRRGIAVDGYGIVAGLHRLSAAKALGWVEIPAHVVELDDLHRQLAECDENLAGPKLTPSERALFTRRRKEIYEALHPETRAAQNASTARKTSDNLSFVSDTAERTGTDRRTVEREAARGQRIAEDVLESVKGTALDKGVELDALAKLPEPEQRALAEQARAGERVSARKVIIAADPLNDPEAKEKQVAALMAAWNRAGPEAREEFLCRIDRPVFDRSRAGGDF